MNRRVLTVLLAVLAAGLVIPACNQGPRPGDTVSPQLMYEVDWNAGGEGSLMVELVAENATGHSRRLGFLPNDNNPTAEVVFYGIDGEPVGDNRVELSHRC